MRGGAGLEAAKGALGTGRDEEGQLRQRGLWPAPVLFVPSARARRSARLRHGAPRRDLTG